MLSKDDVARIGDGAREHFFDACAETFAEYVANGRKTYSMLALQAIDDGTGIGYVVLVAFGSDAEMSGLTERVSSMLQDEAKTDPTIRVSDIRFGE